MIVGTDAQVGIINDPDMLVQTVGSQYDVLLSLADKGYTLLLVGEDINPNDELLQKLELSGMFKVQYQLQPLDQAKYNRVKGSFLASAQGQGPRDKWGKVK